MGGVVDLSHRKKLDHGNYLVDTNILLYLFDPIQNRQDPGYTSIIYDALENSQIVLYVNSHIISEFINRLERIAFAAYKNQNCLPDMSFKKDFQQTKKFDEILAFALGNINKEILPYFHFAKELEEENILKALNTDFKDFNDQILIQSAIQNHLSIITHDRDFFKQQISADSTGFPKIYTWFQH